MYKLRRTALILAASLGATAAHATFYTIDSAPRLLKPAEQAATTSDTFLPITQVEPGLRAYILPYSVSSSRVATPGNMPTTWENGTLKAGAVLQLRILVPPGVSTVLLDTTSATNFGTYSGTSGRNLLLCPNIPVPTSTCPVSYMPSVSSSEGYIDYTDRTHFGEGSAAPLAGALFPNADMSGASDKPRWFNFYYFVPSSHGGGGILLNSFGLRMFLDNQANVDLYNRWLAARPWSSHSIPGVAKEASCDGLQQNWVSDCSGVAPWPGQVVGPTPGPTALAFGARTGAELNAVVESSELTQAGNGGPWQVSITGGEYSLNGAAYTSQNGQIKIGDRIKLRLTTAGTPQTSRQAVLTVGTISSTFAVTTKDQATQLLSVIALKDGQGKVFTGRSASLLDEQVRITESQLGALKGSVRAQLSGNAKFSLGSTISFSADRAGVGEPVPIKITAQNASDLPIDLPTDPGDRVTGYLQIGNGAPLQLDLGNVTTPGELTLNLSGALSNSTKIAQVVDATTYPNLSSQVALTPGGSAVAVPEIKIAESTNGALALDGNKTLAILLPNDVTFDTAAAPTLAVSNASGVLATVQLTSSFGSTGRDLKLTLPDTWDSAKTGPYTISIKGLKIQASSNAVASDLEAVVGGAKLTGTVALSDADIGWDYGAKATRKGIKLGTVGQGEIPWTISPGLVSVADPKSAVISGIKIKANSKDLGKPGASFVAAILDKTLLFLTPAGWLPYSDLLNCYATNSCQGRQLAFQKVDKLDGFTIDVLPQAFDISALKPLQLIIGYGAGNADNPLPYDPAGAFGSMLKGGNFKVIYNQ
ncbi:hypothetical protein [Chitinimonas lacunae]|uniref:Uncharacterized protein n=1 Tax=Chitinimonas lacunae TaxID=1963018 RepID=A0ABV8MXD8_9NEIS